MKSLGYTLAMAGLLVCVCLTLPIVWLNEQADRLFFKLADRRNAPPVDEQ